MPFPVLTLRTLLPPMLKTPFAGLRRVLSLILYCLACGASSAHAQSIYGPGGLLLNPTADVPPKGKITPAVLVMPQKLWGTDHFQSWTSYDVDYGVTDRLEAGLTVLSITPDNGNPSTGGYLKYLVARENEKAPAIAIGGSDVSGGGADSSSLFVAIRKTLLSDRCAHPAHLHLGLSYFDKLDGLTHNHAEPFAGVDWGLTRRLAAFGEARAALPVRNGDTDGTNPARAFGLVWTPNNSYKVAVGFANNGWNRGAPTFTIGVGYSIGGGR